MKFSHTKYMNTENKVMIRQNIDIIYTVLHDISGWSKLFTEYETSKVIEWRENYIKYILKTKPNDKKSSREWTTELILLPEVYEMHFKRISNLFPFSYMNAIWKLKQDKEGVELTWIQEFDMDAESPYSAIEAANFIRTNSSEQLLIIKEKIEVIKSV